MSTKDKLKLVKNLLVNNGWCQHTFGSDYQGPHCLLGAINTIANRYSDFDHNEKLRFALEKGISKKTKKGFRGSCIIEYNDKKARPFKEILEVIKLAEKYI